MKERINEPTKPAIPTLDAEWNDLPDWSVRVEALESQAIIYFTPKKGGPYQKITLPVNKANKGATVSHHLVPFEIFVLTKWRTAKGFKKFIGYTVTICYK